MRNSDEAGVINLLNSGESSLLIEEVSPSLDKDIRKV